MQQSLWGDPIQETRQSPDHTTTHGSPTVSLTPADCLTFGHTWQVIGLSNEKQCLVCKIKGYCPDCTNSPPPNAQPFYCSRHTQQVESQVGA